MCYGQPFENYKITYISGDYSMDVEKIINNKMASGIGFCVALTM